MTIKFVILADILIEIVHVSVIFTYLKLWIKVERQNFKWVRILIHNLTLKGVNLLHKWFNLWDAKPIYIYTSIHLSSGLDYQL